MRKVLLISLDAFFEPDLDRIPPGGAIARLLREGTWCRKVETIFPALTYPIHVTMVTGCDPADTGIGQNQPFQPDVPKEKRRWYWERKHIRVPTLFEAVKEAGGKSCSILWPVNCKNPAVSWCFPEVHPLPGENTVLKVLRYGTPHYILVDEKRFRHLRRGIEEPWLSDYAAALAGDTVRRHKPELTALHLIDLDHTRHHCGTFSREADEAIRRLDRRVGDLLKVLENTPGMEDALMILVSDHGQADITRTVNLRESLIRLIPDFPLRPQSNGMSAYLFPVGDIADPDSLIPLLDIHREELGISHIYSSEELRQLHAVSGPVLAVEAAEGVVFSDSLDPEKREKATHGFGPGHPGNMCIFMVYGQGVRPGSELPSFPMRDVGPTIAGLMGLKLPAAKGKDHSKEILD
jgi:predicted AlkP superfamily pyrophosphatase or phosphodiesterase